MIKYDDNKLYLNRYIKGDLGIVRSSVKLFDGTWGVGTETFYFLINRDNIPFITIMFKVRLVVVVSVL